jgi:1,4-dihydroxy-2-naphthoyl-CoA hydrolase
MTDSEAAPVESLDPSTLDLGELASGFAAHMGLEVTEVSPDRVVGHWQPRAELDDADGHTHRGAHSTVIESLASIAGAVWWGTRGQVVGVNNNTDFLIPESAGPFVSTASPVQRASDQQLWMVETTDPAGKVVVRGHVRLQNLETRV